jgi:hypothetical protein
MTETSKSNLHMWSPLLSSLGGFHRVLHSPPPSKTDHQDIYEILLKVALNTIILTPIKLSPVLKGHLFSCTVIENVVIN